MHPRLMIVEKEAREAKRGLWAWRLGALLIFFRPISTAVDKPPLVPGAGAVAGLECGT